MDDLSEFTFRIENRKMRHLSVVLLVVTGIMIGLLAMRSLFRDPAAGQMNPDSQPPSIASLLARGAGAEQLSVWRRETMTRHFGDQEFELTLVLTPLESTTFNAGGSFSCLIEFTKEPRPSWKC